MKDFDFVVCDLETLDLYDDAVIVSMGWVAGKFEDEPSIENLKTKTLYVEFDIKEQISKYKRKVGASTKEFWKDLQAQKSPAYGAVIPKDSDVSIEMIPSLLDGFLTKHQWKNVSVFDRSAFDIKKLTHIIEHDLNKELPWSYKEYMELATFCKALGFDRYAGYFSTAQDGLVLHNALDDAILDAYRIQLIIKELS